MIINKYSTIILENNFEKKITISKNTKVNIIEIINDKNINDQIEITLEKNSNLNLFQIIFNCEKFQNNIYLKSNSNYNLKSVFYGDKNNMEILNSSTHLEEKSKSNMQIKGATINGSKVICNGLIKIEKIATNSIGNQKISGLILDEISSISSEPILEINNNVVMCSHGCSISQIREDDLFYMKSRGISKKDSINLILKGIFNELVTDIKDTKIKKRIEILINNSLKNEI